MNRHRGLRLTLLGPSRLLPWLAFKGRLRRLRILLLKGVFEEKRLPLPPSGE
jgi:hypothetical protein